MLNVLVWKIVFRLFSSALFNYTKKMNSRFGLAVLLAVIILFSLPPAGTIAEDGVRCQFPNRAYFVGEFAFQFASGDLDVDGYLDVIVSIPGLGEVSILFGQGDGLFAEPINLPVGEGLWEVAIADFDGDSDRDFVVCNIDSNEIVQYENLGFRTFAELQAYAAGENPIAITTADLNSDKAPDVLVLNRDDETITYFLNDGSGMLEQPQILDISFPNSFSTRFTYAVGDIDQDGDADVVAPNLAGSLAVHYNDGLADFGKPMLFINGGGDVDPFNSELADVNNDGSLDFVVGGDNTISVIFNQGNGVFDTENYDVYPMDECVSDFSMGDIDGDGDIDIFSSFDESLITNEKLDAFVILKNDGNGVYAEDSLLNLGHDPRFVGLHDFDNDQDLDAGVISSSRFAVIENRSGDFSSYESAPSLSRGVYGASGDFDQDGNLDLVSNDELEGDGRAVIRFGDGAGNFDQFAVAPSSKEFATSIAAANLDSDQDTDLIIGDAAGISLLFNDGSGESFVVESFLTAGIPANVNTIDVDADGDVDLIFSHNGADGFSVSINDGLGSFSIANTILTPLPIRDLEAADIDADNDIDVVIVDDSDAVTTYRNLGNFEFAADTPITSVQSVRDIVLEDFGGDQLVDIAISSSHPFATTLELRMNDGEGNFANPQNLPAYGGTLRLIAVDVNGDHYPDLVNTQNILPGLITVWMNEGDGVFQSPMQYLVPANADLIVGGDFNSDSSVDLVVFSSFPENVYYPLLSDCIVLGDVNGDGEVDLLDVAPFVDLLTSGSYTAEADINGDGVVNLLDVGPFVELLTGN